MVDAIATWNPRRIVLFVCYAADSWRDHMPQYQTDIYAPRGIFYYNATHVQWESGGCSPRRSALFTRVLKSGFECVNVRSQ